MQKIRDRGSVVLAAIAALVGLVIGMKSCCRGPNSLFSLATKEVIISPNEKVAKSLPVSLPAHTTVMVLVTLLATSGC